MCYVPRNPFWTKRTRFSSDLPDALVSYISCPINYSLLYLFAVSSPMWCHFVLVSPITHALVPMKMSSRTMRLFVLSAITFCMPENRMLLNCIPSLESKRKFRECHNYKPQPTPDTQRKRTRTKINACKINKQLNEKPIDKLALLQTRWSQC